MKNIIEKTLPLKAINEVSINEKIHSGHPGNMHIWWNRSPIYSSEKILNYAFDDLQNIEDGVTIADPFSGFGGLTVAAMKAGLNVYSSDINSVAVVLTKAASELPMIFYNQNAVNPNAENKLYVDFQGIQEDVKKYGESLKKRAEKILEKEYVTFEEIYSWIWVRVVKCPNPACDCEMPLGSSFVLSKMKDHDYWAEPICEDKKLKFKIHSGECPEDKQTNKVVSTGAKFKCPFCGSLTTDDYIKAEGNEGRLKNRMIAVCKTLGQNRTYEYVDGVDECLVDLEEIPVGEMPNNTRWFSPPLYGMKEYSNLYLPRQLKLLATLCDITTKMIPEIEADAINAGLVDDGKKLIDDGKGALAYAEAIAVYLSIVISKLANYQSTICTWDNRKGNIRAAFTRQAIPMTYVFAEGNPFSKVTGNYETMLKNVVDSIGGFVAGKNIKVCQGDALTMDFPGNSVLFTELPYWDNVGYSDLSDYFYIWMRRCLKSIYPNIFEKVVTSKEELTSIAEHYENDSKKASEAYCQGIERFFKNFSKRACEKYPSIVFFELNKNDWNAITTDGEYEETSLEMILSKIQNAGFIISAIWPVRTEKPSERFESYRIAIVFKKYIDEERQTTRRGFINILKRELPELLDEVYGSEMSSSDKPVVGLGKGLEILTSYTKILNADGSNMSIHDGLQLIYQEVHDYLNQNDTAEDAEVKEE